MDDTSTDTDQQGPGNGATGHEAASSEDHDGTRLDDLGERIQSVRAEAEDAVEGLVGDDDKARAGRGEKETYAESGDEASTDNDDQTIAPG